MKKHFSILLILILSAVILIPVSASEFPNKFSITLPLINEIPSGLEQLIDQARKKDHPLAIERKNNTGNIKVEFSNSVLIEDNSFSIDGKAILNFNGNKYNLDFKEADLNVITLENGLEYYVGDIDINFNNNKFDQIGSIHVAWVPNTNMKFASISIGTIGGGNGVAILNFGNPFETQEFMDQVKKVLLSSEKKNAESNNTISTNWADVNQNTYTETVNTLSINWVDVNHRTTIYGIHLENQTQNPARTVVATIGSKYEFSNKLGEVEIRVFATSEDIKNKYNRDYVVANKIRAGVSNSNGQLTNWFPKKTDGSTTLLEAAIFDYLSYKGIPSNTISVFANNFKSAVYEDPNGTNNLDIEMRSSIGGFGSTVELPSTVATSDADEYYEGSQKGAAFRFTMGNYSDYANINSHAQVRYQTIDDFGQLINLWSEQIWYNHYLW